MLGITFALIAAVGFGSGAIFARLGGLHMRSTTGTVVSLAAGFLMTFMVALVFNLSDMLSLSGAAFAWFLLAGAIHFPIGRLLNFTGITLAGVSRAAPIVGVSPLFAVLLALTLGNEAFEAPMFIGTVLVVAGVALIVSQR